MPPGDFSRRNGGNCKEVSDDACRLQMNSDACRYLRAFEPVLLENGIGYRSGQEIDQAARCIWIVRRGMNAARKHSDVLDFGRQWTDEIDARHVHEFAHLLEPDLGF